MRKLFVVLFLSICFYANAAGSRSEAAWFIDFCRRDMAANNGSVMKVVTYEKGTLEYCMWARKFKRLDVYYEVLNFYDLTGTIVGVLCLTQSDSPHERFFNNSIKRVTDNNFSFDEFLYAELGDREYGKGYLDRTDYWYVGEDPCSKYARNAKILCVGTKGDELYFETLDY